MQRLVDQRVSSGIELHKWNWGCGVAVTDSVCVRQTDRQTDRQTETERGIHVTIQWFIYEDIV